MISAPFTTICSLDVKQVQFKIGSDALIKVTYVMLLLITNFSRLYPDVGQGTRDLGHFGVTLH